MEPEGPRFRFRVKGAVPLPGGAWFPRSPGTLPLAGEGAGPGPAQAAGRTLGACGRGRHGAENDPVEVGSAAAGACPASGPPRGRRSGTRRNRMCSSRKRPNRETAPGRTGFGDRLAVARSAPGLGEEGGCAGARALPAAEKPLDVSTRSTFSCPCHRRQSRTRGGSAPPRGPRGAAAGGRARIAPATETPSNVADCVSVGRTSRHTTRGR